jgi:creatinine amidohydrolase
VADLTEGDRIEPGRSGFRRIAVVNGHGGNDELIRVAARDIHNAYNPPPGGTVVAAGAEVCGVSVAATSYWTAARRDLAPVVEAEGHGALPGHAGAFETSLVLALRPDLVDQASYPPALPARPIGAAPVQSPTVMRAGESLGTSPGYTDDPRQASAEAWPALPRRDRARPLDLPARLPPRASEQLAPTM